MSFCCVNILISLPGGLTMNHGIDGRRDSNVSSEFQASGNMQSSYLRRTRQSVPNVKERFGSNCSLATLTG